MSDSSIVKSLFRQALRNLHRRQVQLPLPINKVSIEMTMISARFDIKNTKWKKFANLCEEMEQGVRTNTFRGCFRIVI